MEQGQNIREQIVNIRYAIGEHVKECDVLYKKREKYKFRVREKLMADNNLKIILSINELEKDREVIYRKHSEQKAAHNIKIEDAARRQAELEEEFMRIDAIKDEDTRKRNQYELHHVIGLLSTAIKECKEEESLNDRLYLQSLIGNAHLARCEQDALEARFELNKERIEKIDAVYKRMYKRLHEEFCVLSKDLYALQDMLEETQ